VSAVVVLGWAVLALGALATGFLAVATVCKPLAQVAWREWPGVLVILLAGPECRRQLAGILWRRHEQYLEAVAGYRAGPARPAARAERVLRRAPSSLTAGEARARKRLLTSLQEPAAPSPYDLATWDEYAAATQRRARLATRLSMSLGVPSAFVKMTSATTFEVTWGNRD
jgi:hypothetical protein